MNISITYDSGIIGIELEELKPGMEGDNFYRSFNYTFPSELSDYSPYLEIENRDGKKAFPIINNTTPITSSISTRGQCNIQVVFVKDELVIGKSPVVSISFPWSIMALDEIPEDDGDLVHSLYADAFAGVDWDPTNSSLHFKNITGKEVDSVFLTGGSAGDLPYPDNPLAMSAVHLNNWYDISQVRYIVQVDPSSDSVVENGSQYFPYKRIQTALTDNAIIDLTATTYLNDIRFDNAHYQFLRGVGSIGQRRSIIDANVIVEGDSDNIGFTNINFTGQAEINSTSGTVSFDNCHLASITFGTSSGGEYIFNNCDFDSDIQIYGSPTVTFQGCNFGDTGIVHQNTATSNLNIRSCRLLTLWHGEGKCQVHNTTFKSFGSNTAINSTASNSESLLALFSGTTFRADYTYSHINKVGSCRFIIGAGFHHSNTDTLNGVRLGFGVLSTDVTHDGEKLSDILNSIGDFRRLAVNALVATGAMPADDLSLKENEER